MAESPKINTDFNKRGFDKIDTGCPLRLEKLEILEKLENEPFSEFGWRAGKP